MMLERIRDKRKRKEVIIEVNAVIEFVRKQGTLGHNTTSIVLS